LPLAGVSDAQVKAMLGSTLFDYGASEQNLAMIEQFAAYLFDQKLVGSLPDIRRIFPTS
jgi:hypothetical protein